ncbi:hypothetical protein F5Y01DRAFT_319115 [Xylaria sp. FL0043]|nr:hypothetical protein F5Y01DRAFT_319115 [Xylaria sp. FL0043]
MATQADNSFEEVEGAGADGSNNGKPLILGSGDGPVRLLQIDGGRGFQLATHENGTIRGLSLDDFGSIAIELSKTNAIKNSQNDYNSPYRSILMTGGVLGLLSSVVQNDRDAFLAARTNKATTPKPARFRQYVVVRDRKLRVRLIRIAGYLEYLDRGFAEYFQAAGYSDDRAAVRKLLDHARQTIQSEKPSSSSYTGELGKFCESVLAAWKCTSETTEWVEYRPRIRNDEDKMQYLQDALEIPYWDFMIKSFMDWRHSHPNHVGANGMLYVLSHISATCRRNIRRINKEMSKLDQEDQTAVRAVIEGIEQRLKLLDSVLYGTTIDLDDLDDDLTSERLNRRETEESSAEEDSSNNSSETSMLIGLVFGFLILSTSFFSKGFAISWADNKTGSFGDADFWYLCQSNVMFVLGSLATAMPLLKHKVFGRTRTIFWLLFAIGVVTVIASIAIYVYFNTCYSALVAYLGSISSAGSLLALTQATTQESHGKANVQGGKSKVRRDKLKQP